MSRRDFLRVLGGVTACSVLPGRCLSRELVSGAKPWRNYVTDCLDTLIDKGTDRYGPVETPMFMAILDVHTHESPQHPPMLDADVRTEGRPDHGRRSPAGSNLWHDMATIRVLYRASKVTGNSKYAAAADAYLKAFMKRAVKANGMFAWGSHIYYNAFEDRPGGDNDGDGPHEILIKHPDWGSLYRIDPAAVRREIDGIWKWHIVDKQSGLHNRHDDGRKGCDFAFSGGSFAIAFAFLYSVTKQPHYLEKAKLVANWHWQHRHPQTGLVADSPSTGSRYDALHCFTTVPGPHASQLLRCYELTGDREFRDYAIAYILAYDRYGWDAQARRYHGMLKLDGTPISESDRGAGYDRWQPTGHIDVWRTVMYSYEFPLIAAQSAVYALELTEDEQERTELLRAALRWAKVIARESPPTTGRRWRAEIEDTLPDVKSTGGTYAENYGRAISFFVGLFHVTADIAYLQQANMLAQEAVDKLYVNGIFRGHPAKNYYQANDGVGFLLHALMQLDALPERWRLAF